MAEQDSAAIGNNNHGLRGSRIIGDLSEASLQRIGKLARRIKLGAREALFTQDDPGNAFYVIEAGSIEISILARSGKKLSLNVMRPPDVFGEIAALDGGRRTATATALEECVVLRFSRVDIQHEISTRPKLALDLIQILCARVRWINQQVQDLAMLNVEERLAHRLLILHRKFADDDGHLRLSQSELADFLGAPRESINKVLQGWRAKKLIELSRGSVKVVDQAILGNIAGVE